MKKKLYWWLLPLLCAAALIPVLLGGAFPRLEVAGFRIEQEEYLQAMYLARNQVLSDHAAAGISLTDWNRETTLGDPVALTVERTLDLLRESYAVSTLAVERGYLADAGYDAMLRDMEELNRQRQEALDSGAVISGLPAFTAADFLDYRASSLRLQFCSDPDNSDAIVTPEEIEARYLADRDSLYRQPDSMVIGFLVIDAAPEESDALEQTLRALPQGRLTDALEQTLRSLPQGRLTDALEDFPQLQAYYQEISIQPGNYGAYDRSHGEVLALAAELQSGERSGVIRQGERLYLVECLDRTVHSYVPLEDVQSVVAQSIRERRYDALIAARAEQLPVHAEPDRLYRFTAEQLP